MSKQQQLSNELHSVRVEMHTKERAAEDAARKLRSAHECEVSIMLSSENAHCAAFASMLM